jgi:hypothetical protein
MKINSVTASCPHETEPSSATWRDKATYKEVLLNDYLSPLDKAAHESGTVPRDLQRMTLENLHWYFTTDCKERAPTVAVDEPMAVEFHDIVGRIMRHIDITTIASIDSPEISAEVKHALLSYKNFRCHSPVAIDAIDHDQKLIRITYFLHGDKPNEVFLLDGRETAPAFAKYRACNYFRRMLLRQRIVWLPFTQEKNIEVFLDGKLTEITLGKQNLVADETAPSSSVPELLTKARLAFPSGRGGRQPLPFNLSGLKARLLRWVACLPPVRKRYEKAWVFIDREYEADDSAEHLYRWIMKNHPDINAWFLLTRDSYDWARLAAEGFRLVPPGLKRKLLILNSDHIISSHTDYKDGKFDKERYGDLMRWRFTFPQHGIIKDDVSHWLSNQPFDIFVTSSPDEHASIVDDDTPYTYTAREMRRTGLPRHDRLLRYAREVASSDVQVLLVMPTWRGGLVDTRASQGPNENPVENFARSEYAQHWGALLRHPALHELMAKHGKKLVFMPHANAVPYIAAFSLPPNIEVATADKTSIQKLFSRSIALVTDYTSVAFEFALLRRPVFYYQFDRATFYGGNHNWREGYFSYERDGFGPVSLVQDDLLMKIRDFLENGARPAPEYLARMEHAMPDVDGSSCKRLFEEIMNIRKPHVH